MKGLNLELKVLGALKEKKAVQEPDEALRITKGAYEKAMLYAKLVSEIAGSGMECYGYLLKPKDSVEDIVTDVYLGDGQDALSAHVYLSGEGVKRAMDEMEPMGYQIVGWWHSHGTMDTFHSGWDKRNFLTVLHSIAPRTMYRIEEIDVSREEGDVWFDAYKVKGVPEDADVKVLRKVERDPFVYSMVVNVYKDTHIECQRKSFDAEKGRFAVQDPVRPPKDIVEGDCALDVPTMEWDIYEKVRMQRDARKQESMGLHDYSEIEKLALDKAKRFVWKGTPYEKTIHDMVVSEKGGFDVLLEAEQERVGPAACVDILKAEESHITESLGGTNPETLYDNGAVKTKSALEKCLYLDFLGEFMSVNAPNHVIREYSGKAKELKAVEDIAEMAVKTLTRYAMEKHTDYAGERNHAYGDYMAGVLTSYLSQDCIDACMQEPAESPKDFFLIHDRVGIFNALVNDLYEGRTEHREFFREFPRAYDEGEADACIEKHLGGYDPASYRAPRHTPQRRAYTGISEVSAYGMEGREEVSGDYDVDVEEIREEVNGRSAGGFMGAFQKLWRGFM